MPVVTEAPLSRSQPRYRGLMIQAFEVTLDGSNPTPITTPFRQVFGAWPAMKRTAAQAAGAAGVQQVTVDYSATSNIVNVYGWGSTATADTAEVASTNSTVVITVLVVGVM